jgi:excinuclease ABC subunit C
MVRETRTKKEPGRLPDRTVVSPAAGPNSPGNDAGDARTGVQIIRDVVKILPQGPGVYRMVDKAEDVLYVGKARNLQKRVAAYAKTGGHTHRIAQMIAKTASMEVVTTRSETEALLLEANLIKRLRPRYNVLLRDDKSFPYIHVTGDHAFPQAIKHRGARNRAGEYYGPFASAGAVNRTLNTLQRAFLLRSCSDSVFENRSRPCLLYQIKRCSAPCVDHVNEAEYAELLTDAQNFLKGKSTRVKEHMSLLMDAAAAELDFEKAATYRDRIRALSHVQMHQGINPSTVDEADVVAAFQEGGQTCIQVFFFRAGQNWGNRAYFPRHDKTQTVEEVLGAFLSQFYDNKPPPRLVLISHKIEERDLLAEALTIRAERKVVISKPIRGEKMDLINHAMNNARDALGRRQAENATERRLLEQVAEAFSMDAPPARIEVYDNSHIQGAHPIGGMIVSGIGGFQKNQYRKFNIKNKEATPGDDYAMMREVLTRRFSRLLKEQEKRPDTSDESASQWPDLILIDGGAGQLSATRSVFDELGIDDVTVVSIAKGPDRDAGRERFFMFNRAPFMLETRSPVLYFLQRLRDEAHRFAIGGHRARRSKAIGKSTLDQAPGIGAARKRALLSHFGSAKAVERASLPDLEAVTGISTALARKIFDYFQGDA